MFSYTIQQYKKGNENRCAWFRINISGRRATTTEPVETGLFLGSGTVVAAKLEEKDYHLLYEWLKAEMQLEAGAQQAICR